MIDFRKLFNLRSAPYHIFQIGFNRCGTSSFTHFFEQNGYTAAHWRGGTIAVGIELARLRDEPLLTHVKDFDVYTDMEKVNVWRLPNLKWRYSVFRKYLREVDGEVEDRPPIYAFKYFKQLHQQYPESKFILNTRNVHNWIESRINLNKNKSNRIAYRSCFCGDNVHDTEEALAECWRKEWYNHHQAVKKYFSDKPDSLLIFDIENDPPAKITSFFDDLDLDPSHWQKKNQTVRN